MQTLEKSVFSCIVVPHPVTPWTVACQSPLSVEFSRQEYWNGLPFPSPGDLPNPGIEPGSAALQADVLPSEPSGKPNYSVSDLKTFLPSESSSSQIHTVFSL